MTNKRNLAEIAAARGSFSLLDQHDLLKGSNSNIANLIRDGNLADKAVLAPSRLLGSAFPPPSAVMTALELAARGRSSVHTNSAVAQIMEQVAKDHAGLSKQMLAALGATRSIDQLMPNFMTNEIMALTRSLNLKSTVTGMLNAKAYDAALRGIAGDFAFADKTLRDSLMGITKPWAVAGFESASLSAAIGLGQLATLNRSLPAFGFERVALAKHEFGDFDSVFVDAESAEDDETSELVYTDAGRNPALIAFPLESFDEVLRATGWAYDLPVPDTVRDDGTIVPNVSFDPHDSYLVTMVEAHLRALIIQTLTIAGGIAALKSSFGERLEKWEAKRADSVSRGGENLHLIYSSDLMELHDIVINRQFWKTTFQPIFGDKDVFRVTMRELHAIRLQTAHAKPLTRTARLYLSAAALKIFHAMKIVGLPN